MVDPPPSNVPAWLGFISSLIWQTIIVVVLVYLRREIADLFRNIATLKIKDFEFAFQAVSPDAESPKGDAAAELLAIGPGGFLTKEGVRKVVGSSELTESGEKVNQDLLIFSTRKQRTWLVSTDKKLFCLLDDDSTRTSGRIIQWVLKKEDAKPIEASKYKWTVGLLSVGLRKNWLYSTRLFSKPEDLQKKVAELVDS